MELEIERAEGILEGGREGGEGTPEQEPSIEEQQEQARIESAAEQAAERLEEETERDPEGTREAMLEDVGEALVATPLSQEQRETVLEAAHGLRAAAAVQESGGEVDMQTIIERMLKERYDITIAEFLGAYRPTKLEYLNPVMAASQEAGVWAMARGLGIEVPDLSLRKKAEVRWKTFGDAGKVLSLLAGFFHPGAGKAIGVGSEVARRAGDAMERVNGKPDATNYDITRELTIATLPRNTEGAIDSQAVYELLRQAGGRIAESPDDDPETQRVLKNVGTWIVENPDKVAEGFRRLDAAVQKARKG